MIYEVENLPKRVSVDVLDSALSFASNFLELDIDLVLEFESLKKHQCAFLDYDEGEVTITIAKRLSLQELIRTLFHEMVHVKQYADGRLEHVGVWMGQKYDCDYVDLPWEQEAFYLEQIMYEQFLKKETKK